MLLCEGRYIRRFPCRNILSECKLTSFTKN